MHARQGDQIVIDTTTLDALRRHGYVIEVIGQGERKHYRIRWQTGHESVYFPGPDARVVSVAVEPGSLTRSVCSPRGNRVRLRTRL